MNEIWRILKTVTKDAFILLIIDNIHFFINTFSRNSPPGPIRVELFYCIDNIHSPKKCIILQNKTILILTVLHMGGGL